jgi:hypothetical protein
MVGGVREGEGQWEGGAGRCFLLLLWRAYFNAEEKRAPPWRASLVPVPETPTSPPAASQSQTRPTLSVTARQNLACHNFSAPELTCANPHYR